MFRTVAFKQVANLLLYSCCDHGDEIARLSETLRFLRVVVCGLPTVVYKKPHMRIE